MAMAASPHATLTLTLTYKGRQKNYDLKLPQNIIEHLTLEAHVKHVTLGDIVASRILAGEWKRGNGP